jgi:hypothetical protein
MSSGVVFLYSLICCFFFFILERMVGIGWDFHPDAVTYTQKYLVLSENLIEQGFLSFPNNVYYLVSYFLNGNISLLIILNVLAYSFTNVLIAKEFKRFSFYSNWGRNKKIWLLLLLLFIPYRLHLAVHVLKDTLILLGLVLVVVNANRKTLLALAFIPTFLLRVLSIVYLTVLMPNKIIKFGIPIVIIFMIFNSEFITSFLLGQNALEMTFRESDRVPTFQDLGLIGVFIRGIVWPIFNLTGIYAIISPSILYLPVAIGSFMIQLWSFYVFKKFAITPMVFCVMALIALLVPGYASYIRYCFPILIVTPLLMMKANPIKYYTATGKQ